MQVIVVFSPLESSIDSPSIDSHSKTDAGSTSHGARTATKSGEKAVVVCHCGYEAVKFTVKKDTLCCGWVASCLLLYLSRSCK